MLRAVSADRVDAIRQDAMRRADKAHASEAMPPTHPLWKPWALDLADDVIRLLADLRAAVDSAETIEIIVATGDTGKDVWKAIEDEARCITALAASDREAWVATAPGVELPGTLRQAGGLVSDDRVDKLQQALDALEEACKDDPDGGWYERTHTEARAALDSLAAENARLRQEAERAVLVLGVAVTFIPAARVKAFTVRRDDMLAALAASGREAGE